MNRKYIGFLVFLIIFLSACSFLNRSQNDEVDMLTGKELITQTEALQPTTTQTIEPVLQSACQEMSDDENQVAVSVAETYDVTYEQIMNWFCQGYSFENILVALETSTLVDYSTEELLEMTKENNWDEIWKSTGFIN